MSWLPAEEPTWVVECKEQKKPHARQKEEEVAKSAGSKREG